jgi:pSer/pThr/pTyr-binding forkhead associated (FHA) protein
MECPDCGFNNTPGSVFCGDCGRRLDSVAAESALEEEITTEAAAALSNARTTDASGRIVVSRTDSGQIQVKKVSGGDKFLRVDCPYCGRSVKIPDGATLCPYCGAGLADGTPPQEGYETTEITSSRRDASRPVARLFHLLPQGDEKEIPLEYECATIGRTRGLPKELVFETDPYLSPRHAELRYEGDRIRMVDLGSLNGVFLRIERESPLSQGSVFVLGEQVFRFEVVKDHPGAPEPDKDGTVPMGGGLERAGAKLVKILADGGDGPEYHVIGARCILGRQEGQYTFPDDATMSLRHAEIRERGGNYMLADLRSTNGTFLRVEEMDLGAGAMVRIGSQRFRVEYESAEV